MPCCTLVLAIASLCPSVQSMRPPSAPPTPGTLGGPLAQTRLAPLQNITYITGDAPGADVIFKVTYDPEVELSGIVEIAAFEFRDVPCDGIDFVPGTARTEVVIGSPGGLISHFDVTTGATLPDFVSDTDTIAVPPLPGGTVPSSVLSAKGHCYYIENQFGFGGTPSHRIVRVPFTGGPEELVFDGGVLGLANFEGLEIVDERLYFFAAEPGSATTRALLSIGLAAGIWDGIPFELEIPGLFQDPFGTDGSDELDYDPLTGLLFGTNIENGEIIAFDPLAGVEYTSPGSTHFIDGLQIGTASGDLGLLGFAIDGIRSDGRGHLIVSGKGGVVLSILVLEVITDGADDADIVPLVFAPGMFAFDDLSPIF